MSLVDIASKINNCVENLELAAARVYIEENLNVLQEHKNLLSKNARELLDILIELQDEGNKPLSRKDLAILNTINTYARNFDMRGLKVIIKENPELLLRKEVPAYFNSDAKIILEGMGIFK
ncbi:hypothetical protein [Mesobacillus subterraneus]|uniref:Uncharacterized protein n=1 Tax=Mesobacillus subterraneus TaxID=285983 RepID=A0A3R9FQE2_9BACI|nr:hypothetical protein [Mesobacillus subterraneus]RSD21127.1 hypothetical protein EJA10_22335 [Mesobacillus subterraneus]